jgi:hypothetical protein
MAVTKDPTATASNWGSRGSTRTLRHPSAPLALSLAPLWLRDDEEEEEDRLVPAFRGVTNRPPPVVAGAAVGRRLKRLLFTPPLLLRIELLLVANHGRFRWRAAAEVPEEETVFAVAPAGPIVAGFLAENGVVVEPATAVPTVLLGLDDDDDGVLDDNRRPLDHDAGVVRRAGAEPGVCHLAEVVVGKGRCWRGSLSSSWTTTSSSGPSPGRRRGWKERRSTSPVTRTHRPPYMAACSRHSVTVSIS